LYSIVNNINRQSLLNAFFSSMTTEVDQLKKI
jgi:hypothetical protein